MGLMDRFAKLDSAMQRGLDNGLARVFGGHLVPAEIEDALKQEADDNRVHTYEGTIEAPNAYVVNISKGDLDNLSAQHPRLAADLTELMSRHLRNQNWTTVGPVRVSFQVDQSLRTGQLLVHSSTPETTTQEVQLILKEGSHSLQPGSTIIGRGTEADVRLEDTSVSREHAEITWNGENIVLVDLKSTNGTSVNDTPIENWMLEDGDVITLGHSRIEVRIIKG